MSFVSFKADLIWEIQDYAMRGNLSVSLVFEATALELYPPISRCVSRRSNTLAIACNVHSVLNL